ncbi:hypothetical protein [Alkalinema sp. FACHB-956]|uniref:hypothetical protein n=1 Tax=Alkalinema sp. FACHB-956 TaxID=2692768 RepID=UPI001684834D|nr:hypothetical protein [Alkalinema sp. FACHB-956]MBD2329080.1 hypothetical protein [Alkalinema sp. FACHB-956]
MNQQIQSRSPQLLPWSVACMMALAMGLPLGQMFHRTIGDLGGTSWFWLLGWLGGTTITGLCLGGMQGWALSQGGKRDRLPSLSQPPSRFRVSAWLRWMLGTAFGWLLASGISLLLCHWIYGAINLAGFPYLPLAVVWGMSRYSADAIAGAFMGAILAMTQIISVRRSWKFLRQLRWWIIWSSVGWMLGALVADGLTTSIMPNVLAQLCEGAILGGIYGWMTANGRRTIVGILFPRLADRPWVLADRQHDLAKT